MSKYRNPNSVNYVRFSRPRIILGNASGSITKEVTLGKWKGEVRLDIRKWQGAFLGKGISLTEDEVRDLRAALDAIDFGR